MASASPSASAMFAAAIPLAWASCCFASTSMRSKSFSAFSAFCSASTFASIACEKSGENWKSVIDMTSVMMLNALSLSRISTSMSDFTCGLFVISSSAL